MSFWQRRKRNIKWWHNEGSLPCHQRHNYGSGIEQAAPHGPATRPGWGKEMRVTCRRFHMVVVRKPIRCAGPRQKYFPRTSFLRNVFQVTARNHFHCLQDYLSATRACDILSTSDDIFLLHLTKGYFMMRFTHSHIFLHILMYFIKDHSRKVIRNTGENEHTDAAPCCVREPDTHHTRCTSWPVA